MATFTEIETNTPDAATADRLDLTSGPRAAWIALGGILVVLAIPYGLWLAGIGTPPDPAAAVGGAMAETGVETESPVEEFIAWLPGTDKIPFTGLFDPTTSGPTIAEAGGAQGRAAGEGAEGPVVARARTPKVVPVALIAPNAPNAPIEPNAPSPDAAAGPATDDGPDGVVGGDHDGSDSGPEDRGPVAPPKPRLQIPPALYEGVTAEIIDPKGAMAPFYAALARTALKEEGAMTRIAHWGDSVIGSDGMTHIARRHLQAQFGDGGHGFTLVESGSDWYKHKDIKVKRSGWRADMVVNRRLKDGHYGYGGSSSKGYGGARASFATVDAEVGPVGHAASKFIVYYAKAPKQGALEIRVDGGEATLLETVGETLEDAVHEVAMSDGPHEVKIRAKGRVRLFGVALEREAPGVVYDSMGIVGAFASRLLAPDPEHWKGQLDARAPDLMVLMYGGNDLIARVSREKWKANFTKVVARFRTSRPDAACLVMSPVDHGERHRGRIRTVPRLNMLMAVQKEVALEQGCAFWSAFDAMGGEGSMGRWVKDGRGWHDYAHLSPAGSVALGTLWYRALMKGFADHLAAEVPQ